MVSSVLPSCRFCVCFSSAAVILTRFFLSSFSQETFACIAQGQGRACRRVRQKARKLVFGYRTSDDIKRDVDKVLRAFFPPKTVRSIVKDGPGVVRPRAPLQRAARHWRVQSLPVRTFAIYGSQKKFFSNKKINLVFFLWHFRLKDLHFNSRVPVPDRW